MLKFVLAICFIGLALFWVVRCGPHNALRAFVVELLSACGSMLTWIRRVASSNRAIYCFIAFYAMFAMQWHPLWALAPFIAGALIWRGYKKHTVTIHRDRLPSAPASNSNNDPEIPGLSVLMVQPLEQSPTVPQPPLVDPIVTTPSVFLQEPTDWNKFKQPAWQRRGIDVAAVLKAAVLAPVPPAVAVEADVDGVVVDDSHTKVEFLAEDNVQDSENGSTESQGSFVYG